MQVHWAYFGCSKEDEEQLQRHWEDRQRRLESRVEALPEDPVELELVADRQHESPQWQIHSALHLPARTVVVRATENEPAEAVGNIVSGLVAELDRVDERPTQVTLRREGLEGILPILERSRQQQRSDVFCVWLAPIIGTLEAHVRRELRIYEQETSLATGQVTAADILDETLIRAYDRFDRRPAKLSLDLWLLQIVDEVLEESCQTLATESLDQPVSKPSTEPTASSRDSWTERAVYSETIAVGDLLPMTPDAARWDALDFETKTTETQKILGQIPRQQRQVLVLNTVYGYPAVEIADFQDRTEDDVRRDIDTGRQTLAHHFLTQYLPAWEEQLDRDEEQVSRRSRR